MLKSQFSKVIKKLLNIWIAIFFVYMSKICIASSPKIMTNDFRPIKAVGSDWTIECVGERPVTWNYTVMSEPITETTGLNLSSEYPYSATLSITDITYRHRDVQTYKCTFVDEIDVQNRATAHCSFENVSCVHLFVDDETNLLASDNSDTESLRTMASLVGDPLIIPCTPTSPFVKISISRGDQESRSLILPPEGGEEWQVGHPSGGDCGGVIEGLTGEIKYKYRQPYDENEGCIWTISVPNQSLIKVTISETYFRRPTDYLSVGYLKDSAYDSETALTWVKIGYVLAPTTVTVPGPVAFVQFISWTQPGLGFSLNFQGAGNKIVDPDFTYENYFLYGDYGVFKYDKNVNPTTNSKRTTIVIKPTFKNALDASKGAVLNLQSINLENSSNCTGDNLNIFAFEEPGGNHRWFKNHTYCGKYNGAFVDFYTFLPPRHHPFIITMKTGPSCSPGPADPSILNNYALELLWRTF